ncbi:hypothetical protein PLESTB_001384400 [Pleodorina starrii]|uniref:Uncharacterized protein n=1 Tax=Pleodorina starrii TaxID=330485 RepID=A0A9W6F7K9_9CHLO|nr:hypothetical protein PLESTB_001384400 [Pleodorina starrii]
MLFAQTPETPAAAGAAAGGGEAQRQPSNSSGKPSVLLSVDGVGGVQVWLVAAAGVVAGRAAAGWAAAAGAAAGWVAAGWAAAGGEAWGWVGLASEDVG